MSLNNYIRVDDQDDVMAAHVNIPTVSTLRGELGEALAITAQLELTDGDFPYLEITPDADYDVLLPPEASTNHVHVLKNASGTYTLTVKEDSDTTTIETLGPGAVGMFIPALGTGWDVIKTVSNPAASERVHTWMDGLKLTWNSATSIDVGVGACYAEDGSWIDLTSAITKSALSLSASTWYHVYVYLNSGTPAAEVVTTAPVAWKGTAYSKTGDDSRRYIGSVKTDGSGNVYEFIHNPNRNKITYSGSTDMTNTPFLVLSGGTATTATAVDCSGVVAATSMSAFGQIVSVADQILYTGNNSSTQALALNNGNTAAQRAYGDMLLTSSKELYYKFGSAVGTGGAYLYVYGYYFDR